MKIKNDVRQGKQRTLSDALEQGHGSRKVYMPRLCVKVYSKKRATWVYRRTIKGVSYKETLGEAVSLTLAEAVELTKERDLNFFSCRKKGK